MRESLKLRLRLKAVSHEIVTGDKVFGIGIKLN